MPRDGFPDDNLSVRGSGVRMALYAVALALGGGAVAAIASAGSWLLTASGDPAWSAETGSVMLGLAIGVWLGGWLSGPLSTMRVTLRRLAAALGAAAVTTEGAAALPRTVARAIDALGVSPDIQPVLLSLALLLPPSLCAGVALAILLKLAVDERPLARGPVLGGMLACGTLGGFGGSLIADLVSLPRMGAAGTVTFAGLAFAALALVFVLAEPHPAARRNDTD